MVEHEQCNLQPVLSLECLPASVDTHRVLQLCTGSGMSASMHACARNVCCMHVWGCLHPRMPVLGGETVKQRRLHGSPAVPEHDVAGKTICFDLSV